MKNRANRGYERCKSEWSERQDRWFEDNLKWRTTKTEATSEQNQNEAQWKDPKGTRKVIDGLVRGSVRGWADLSSKDRRKIIEGQKKVLLKAVVRKRVLGR
jgi:hypothetical protein